MSDKRIIEYNTATELADDDYLVLDSESGGTCKILAKKLEPVKPEYITAVYTQSGTVYDTDELDVLIPDLVVTAYYEDGTVEHNVSGYILSGELTVGESTITCTYKGKSATFTVTVTANITYLYNWDFTESLVDKVSGLEATLYNGATRTSNGIVFDAVGENACLGDIETPIGKTIEVDIYSFDWQGGVQELVIILNDTSPNDSTQETGGLYRKSYNNGWSAWGWNTDGNGKLWGQGYIGAQQMDTSAIDGKTIKIVYVNDYTQEFYVDDVLIGRCTGAYLNNIDGTNHITKYLWLGGRGNLTYCYNMTIKSVRIYANQ